MKLLYNNKLYSFIFILFVIFSLIASINILKKYLLNTGFNGDEYYLNNIYNLKDLTFEKITSLPSQLYILFASIVDHFLHNPKLSTRLISFLFFLLILIYFGFKIKKLNTRNFVKVQFFLILLFVLTLTRQPFIGTSDFSAYFFLIILIIELNECFFKDSEMSIQKMFILSFFLASSIITRPTVIVILIVYLFSLIYIFRGKIFKFRLVNIIPIISIFFIILMNFGSLKNNGCIILDVKEVPKNEGTNWLERNYLMAKFWDEDKIPKSKWLSSEEVLEYKRKNPSAFIPKSNLDLMINEPRLYIKQMIRMFISANYTMFLYINVFYLITIYIIFKKSNQNKSFFNQNNSFELIDKNRIKLILFLFYLSVIFFSFLAVKLFEFRWVIPIMIVLVWSIFVILTKLKDRFVKIIFIFFYLLFTMWILKGYEIFLMD
jgi:hypothetical protein